MKNGFKIICVKKQKTDTDGYLFLQNKGKENRTKKTLGIKVNVAHFQKYFNQNDLSFRSGMPNYKIFNEQLQEAIKDLDRSGGRVVATQKSKTSFLNFWQENINGITNHGSRIKQQTILDKFKKYLISLKKDDISFTALTPAFIKECYKYLQTTKDPRKLSLNTATHYLKVIKMAIDEKLIEEPYLFTIHPFTGVEYEKKQPVKRPVLQVAEIDKFLLTPINDTKINYNRNKFLFQLWCDGMRVSDMLLLRWNNIITGATDKGVINDFVPNITYQMFKTDEVKTIDWTFQIATILLQVIGRYEQVLDVIHNHKFSFAKDDTNDNLKGQQLSIADIEAIIRNNEADGIEDDDLNEVYIEHNKTIKYSIIEYAREQIAIYVANNKCMDNFVFKHLDNKYFKDIKTGPENGFKSEMMTEAQYQKLINGTILYNRQLKQVAEYIGITTNTTSHGARHSFAQLLINEGAPATEIKDRLGHRNLSTTDEYLRHKSFKHQKNKADIGNDFKYRLEGKIIIKK